MTSSLALNLGLFSESEMILISKGQKQEVNTASQPECNVDVSLDFDIQNHLKHGLWTEDNDGSKITFKLFPSWNKVGLELRFDNGNVAKGININ